LRYAKKELSLEKLAKVSYSSVFHCIYLHDATAKSAIRRAGPAYKNPVFIALAADADDLPLNYTSCGSSGNINTSSAAMVRQVHFVIPCAFLIHVTV
jgi:hypothetical protein